MTKPVITSNTINLTVGCIFFNNDYLFFTQMNRTKMDEAKTNLIGQFFLMKIY